MARPKKIRRIAQNPIIKGFKPFGLPRCKVESIQLSFEEYESIRLVNYEMFQQKEAAVLMNISRPTLTRIYNKALKNITKAFVEGKAILIEGGNYKLENDWYKCKKCFGLIEGFSNEHLTCDNTISCQQNELINLNK